ncbi:hypothetical protein ACIQBJ_16185 [Kitasatospora sp. NPDC088391]|uniref:hypothetical protein n=1 Tax=Kitasatospora sp. NPDC088391 TaxID=3364074 RepID=UPI0037F90902
MSLPPSGPEEFDPWAPNPVLGVAARPVDGPPPRNGLGVAALVVSGAAAVLAVTAALYWAAWLPGAVGVILGAFALRRVGRGLADNKGVATTGVVVGVVAMCVSAVVFGAVSGKEEAQTAQRERAESARVRSEERAKRETADREEAARRARVEADRRAEEQAKKAAEEKSRQLAFGQSYTFEDGLTMTVGAPEPFEADGTAVRAPAGSRLVQVRIVLRNNGPREIGLVGHQVVFFHDARGGLVHSFFDGSGRNRFFADSVAPGAETVYLSAYAVPEDAGATLSGQYTYGTGTSYRPVTWSGPLP